MKCCRGWPDCLFELLDEPDILQNQDSIQLNGGGMNEEPDVLVCARMTRGRMERMRRKEEKEKEDQQNKISEKVKLTQ